jgi:hypothetical protein
MAALLPSRQVFLSTLRRISIVDVPEGKTGTATCSICFGDLADNAVPGASERAVQLHGTHIYGELCIRQWLEEHDSCPTCRVKVHAGTDNDHIRLVNELTAQTRLTVQRHPTHESPIVDLEVFRLFDSLRRARSTITSAPLADQLEACTSALLTWHASWWEHGPLYFILPDYVPYARMQTLHAKDRDIPVVVHEKQVCLLLGPVVTAGLFQGANNTVCALGLYVGTHPLSRAMDGVIRRQVREDQGKRMSVSTLAARIWKSFESDPQTRGVMTGKREDLPRGFRFFWEDVVAVVLRELIGQ